MNKIITVGQSMFDELRRSNSYYVDKTEFLYELRGGKTRDAVSLFTRPRRFGKTLLMSMIENFFNITKDSRDIFEGLDIMKHSQFVEEHMNKYPVLFVSFKDVKGNSYEEAYDGFVNIIVEACTNVTKLVDSERVNPADRNIFKKLESGTANVAQVKGALKLLMKIMYTVYGKKVVLLIDEYDVPVSKAYDIDNSYYNDMLTLIGGVLSLAIKDNEYLAFSVVTGCLRIAKQSIFTDANNFSEYSILNNEFSTYFGFTEREVQDILTYIGCEDKLPVVREWYDGYLFGKEHMYCPWDVINYASKLSNDKDAKPQNYWQNTSSNDLIHKFVQHDRDAEENDNLTRQFNALLGGKVIGIAVESNLTYDMVDSSIDNVWSILLMTGYMTPVEYVGECQYRVKLPNKEIRSLFESTIISKFKRTLDQNKQRALVRALWNKDNKEAAKFLSSLLDTTISYFDFYEIYYHAFLTGVFSGMGYVVKSNKEAGDGRADIIIMDDPCNRAMVIETKRTTAEKEMNTKCDEALQQIKENRYADPLREEYSTVVCIGITFCKKTALVKFMP